MNGAATKKERVEQSNWEKMNDYYRMSYGMKLLIHGGFTSNNHISIDTETFLCPNKKPPSLLKNGSGSLRISSTYLTSATTVVVDVA